MSKLLDAPNAVLQETTIAWNVCIRKAENQWSQHLFQATTLLLLKYIQQTKVRLRVWVFQNLSPPLLFISTGTMKDEFWTGQTKCSLLSSWGTSSLQMPRSKTLEIPLNSPLPLISYKVLLSLESKYHI